VKRFPEEWRKGVSPGTILTILLVFLMVAILGGCKTEGETPAPEAPKAEKPVAETEISCAKCHEMWPEIATWKLSSHSRIACEKCHTQINLKAMEAAHTAGTFSKPIKLKEKIAADTCKTCHSPNRVFSLPGDLIVPHERHDKARVGCTDCHNTVAHYGIVERNVFSRPDFADYAKWTPELAKHVAGVPFGRPSMWQCLNCHQMAGVKTKCADCHKVYTSLPSHEAANWLSTHGREGRKDPSNCTKCHAEKEGPKTVDSGTGDPIIDFERATSYCYNCHKQRPAFHGQDFTSQHADMAKAKGVLNCWACHSLDAPTTTQNVTGTYCNNCHWFQVKKAQATAPAKKE